jgi:tripartite-type tricarboxylate transporter receptor subunit TctC
MRKVMSDKGVLDIMAAQGIAPVDMTPQATVPFFRSEMDKHAKLVKKSGATLD